MGVLGRDIEVRLTTQAVGQRACDDWHYSGQLPPRDMVIGFWRGDVFDGIISFRHLNPPPVMKYWRNVLGGEAVELSRMAFRPQKQRPPTTKYISMALRQLKQMGEWEGVYSYADAARGHKGTVYRAANFLYAGCAERGVAGYRHPDGREFLGRRSLNSEDPRNTVADMLEQGFVPVPGRKHRYVIGLTRPARKLLESQREELATYYLRWSGHYRGITSGSPTC